MLIGLIILGFTQHNEISKLKLDKILAERNAKEGIKEEIESNKIS